MSELENKISMPPPQENPNIGAEELDREKSAEKMVRDVFDNEGQPKPSENIEELKSQLEQKKQEMEKVFTNYQYSLAEKNKLMEGMEDSIKKLDQKDFDRLDQEFFQNYATATKRIEQIAFNQSIEGKKLSKEIGGLEAKISGYSK